MATSQSTSAQSTGAAVTRALAPPTRFDEAHPSNSALVPPAVEKATEVPPAIALQQVRTQAAQLAAHLKRERTAVDHRESELNARLADMESQLRGARLWLNERHLELSEQRGDLARRETELETRDSKSTSNHSPEVSPAVLAELAEQKAELDRRQAELDGLAERLSEQLALASTASEARQLSDALHEHQARLEQAEEQLAQAKLYCDHLRARLTLERREHEEAMQAQREQLAQEKAHEADLIDKARAELTRRGDELAARSAALERLRGDVARTQQETLELRLATEEVWARLCGTMAPAALTQSLAKIRLQIADQQRLARAELAQQKTELEGLLEQVYQQHRQAARQRDELRVWAETRQQEFEKQAALLVRKEHELAGERESLEHARLEWANERFALQQEIRRLLRQGANPPTRSTTSTVHRPEGKAAA